MIGQKYCEQCDLEYNESTVYNKTTVNSVIGNAVRCKNLLDRPYISSNLQTSQLLFSIEDKKKENGDKIPQYVFSFQYGAQA